jgi:DNA-binding transcriptional LysR family regulator
VTVRTVLDIRKLVLLREVEASGSIAAAAEALNYTRSAVSQQLSALEAETGVALVDRGSRRAGLTVAGRTLVEHTERILERVEAAEAVLLAATGGVSGELRVGVPFHEGPALLVPVLTRLQTQHPDLRITLHGVAASEGREAVRLGRLDVVMAARYDQVPQNPVPGLHEEPLTDDRVRIAVAPDDATAAGGHGPVGLGEFAHRPWILDPDSGLGRLALHACAAAGFAPDVVADTGDMHAALGLVSLGWGVALVPDLVPARPGYPVRRIPLAEPELIRRLSLVARRGALERPAVAAVLAAVRVAADTLEHGGGAVAAEPEDAVPDDVQPEDALPEGVQR